MSKFAASIVTLALLLVGAGCIPDNQQAEPGEVPSASVTESTEPLAEGEPEEEEGPAEEEEDPLYKFGDTVTYESGIQITVTQPMPFKNYSYPEELSKNERAVKFLITVKNDSGKRWDPSLLSTTASTGEKEAEEIFDTANGIDGSPDTKLLKGKKRQWPVAYQVRKGEDFVLEISPDWDSEAAIFTS